MVIPCFQASGNSGLVHADQMILHNNVLRYEHFFKLGFTPCKAKQSLQGMELSEKEAQKD